MTKEEFYELWRGVLASDEYMSNMEEQSHVGLMFKTVDVNDPDNDRIEWCNQTICSWVGHPMSRVIGAHPKEFWPNNWNKFREDEVAALLQKEPIQRVPESFGERAGEGLLSTSKYARIYNGKVGFVIIAYSVEQLINGLIEMERDQHISAALVPGAVQAASRRVHQIMDGWIAALDDQIALARSNGQ